MNLVECYDVMGGDYAGVMSRLMKEERVIRFLGKFKDDSMLEPLEAALASENWEEAFRASHNLKGVCQNLGIIRLADSSSELCETMRHGAPSVDIVPLVEKVRQDYQVTIQALEETL